MKKENKNFIGLFVIEAIVNLCLVFVVWCFCRVMAYVYPHIFDDNHLPPSSVTLVLHTYWWPWLLFATSCLCIIATFLNVKHKTLLISAIVILLIDIFCLAITLCVTASLFARPMWVLM